MTGQITLTGNPIIPFLFIVLYSCKTKKDTILICNKENAVNVANGELKKNKYKLEMLNKKIEETHDKFYIHYLPKQFHALGYEAKVWISKKDCSVIDSKFYQ